MRILHTVELYSPHVGGAQEVVRQISERLAARGHQVTVATSRLPERRNLRLNGVTIEEFDIRGNAVLGVEGEAGRYQHFLRSAGFDVILNYAAQQWATDLALPILDDLPAARVLAPCGFSGLFVPEYAAYFRGLPEALARYDRIVLHSDTYRDAEFMRANAVKGTRVIPNGAGEDEFAQITPNHFRRRHGIPNDVPLLLSVGSHTGMKGHGLLLEAFARSRLPRAVMVLIGNAPTRDGCLRVCRLRAWGRSVRSRGRKRVLLLDPPRHEVLAAYAAADLFLLGSRIECSPIVLFEAAASGTAFISVPAGNAQEIAAWTGGGVVVSGSIDRNGFVVADPAELAREVERLLADSDLRKSLGDAGRQAWASRFTWDAIAGRYEEVYQEAIAERMGRPENMAS